MHKQFLELIKAILTYYAFAELSGETVPSTSGHYWLFFLTIGALIYIIRLLIGLLEKLIGLLEKRK